MRPRWGFDSQELAAALLGAVTIGTAWVATGTGGHPLLLFVVGGLIGTLFGLRCAWTYRTSGRVGRFFIVVLAGIWIPLCTVLLAIRRLTDWW